jgi:hypothetical protein
MPAYNSQRRGTTRTSQIVFLISFFLFIVMYVPFAVFCVLFVCKCVLYCCHRVLTKCVLYYCHRVLTKLQLKINNNKLILESCSVSSGSHMAARCVIPLVSETNSRLYTAANSKSKSSYATIYRFLRQFRHAMLRTAWE